MKSLRISAVTALTAAALVLPLACTDSGSTTPSLSNKGMVVVKLTDAPFPTDEVKSVDVFVVRVDARVAATDDQSANQNLDNSESSGWVTLASPNASFNLLALQGGKSTTLGNAALTPGSYSGFRFIIDPAQSSVTLKDGTLLNGTSTPDIKFPSAAKTGLKINLSKPATIVAGTTTTLLIDFDVANSFVLRGNTIHNNGLLFKPVINGTIIDAATVNANVRLANATDAGLDLLQGTTVLASNVAFAGASSCSSVNAATPNLIVANTGTTTALPGLTTTFTAGNSYTIIAYPGASATTFATLQNTFTPTAGQAGLRVLNTTATPYDVYLTALNAVLALPATVANATQGTATAFVSVPAGSEQIRILGVGLVTPVVKDVGSQTITAGTNYTLVIAPPVTLNDPPRAFLVPGC
ncbi:MAG TPA: DUF4382 domain-containing protein [Gemmatimonadaceae bacterium]|nr:DUF4382 domain-containing protein [Gemmatimonadaceae bacterium]